MSKTLGELALEYAKQQETFTLPVMRKAIGARNNSSLASAVCVLIEEGHVELIPDVREGRSKVYRAIEKSNVDHLINNFLYGVSA